MDPRLLLRVLWRRRVLCSRVRWTRAQLLAHQTRAARALRAFTYARSPFYRRFHQGYETRPLPELPVLTRATSFPPP